MPVEIDDDGQTEDPRVMFRTRADRLINEMLGVVKCSLSDGKVSTEEAAYLHDWLAKNPDFAYIWPANVLKQRLDSIFADGTFDEAEQRDLLELYELTAGDTHQRATTSATRLPLDRPAPTLTFSGVTYLFTGKFVSGTRETCQQRVIDRGGICASRFNLRVGVLVIGTLGSKDWARSSHGRKIEEAMRQKDAGHPIVIVDEPHWLSCLDAVS